MGYYVTSNDVINIFLSQLLIQSVPAVSSGDNHAGRRRSSVIDTKDHLKERKYTVRLRTRPPLPVHIQLRPCCHLHDVVQVYDLVTLRFLDPIIVA